MNPKNKNSKINYVEFPINDKKKFQKAKLFYSSVFKWNYKDWGDDYSDTQDSGVSSGINADSSHNTENLLVVIYVENIKEIKENVKKSGGKIIKDIFSFPGGKRFHFTDPGGNELAVWSDK